VHIFESFVVICDVTELPELEVPAQN